MRLAEEYDQAQADNVVRKAGNPIVGDPNNCKVGPADLGIRRDEIHEARKLRDAEREEPGIVARTGGLWQGSRRSGLWITTQRQ
jgi:hypothetical protein